MPVLRFMVSLLLGAVMLALAPAREASAAKFTLLYKFCSVNRPLFCSDGGGAPATGLVMDGSGNLYGTAGFGPNAGGVVFQVTPDGTETVLYAFCSVTSRAICLDGGEAGGGGAISALIMDGSGNLLGTTRTGGRHGSGTIFMVQPGGPETVLYDFGAGKGDAVEPAAPLVMDAVGSLYGTSAAGGNKQLGTVYELSGDSDTVLHSFGAPRDGALVTDAGLVIDAAGNLYGTTQGGGTHVSGTAFKIAPDGTETILYNFCANRNCADGSTPSGAFAMDEAGSLYGVTGGGGAHQRGTVYQLTPNGDGSKWTHTVLYSFCAKPHCADGGTPQGTLLLASGKIYGTTIGGGKKGHSQNQGGPGTVFELTFHPASQQWAEDVLYSFCTKPHCVDGEHASSGVIADGSGVLYGRADLGGNNYGTVFKLEP